ncbi:MAG: hypothetical protein EBX37_11150 [Alphaproteobacteria bacterium]|nr:hypothetical protein [Alphaproteobacteria bacterium]
MRILPTIALPFLLSACHAVGSNPWVGVDYAEMNCGTKEAVLTTTGCVTSPPTAPVTRPVATHDNEETEKPQYTRSAQQRNTDIYNNGVLDAPPPANNVYNNDMNRKNDMHNNRSTSNDVHTSNLYNIQQPDIHNNAVTGVSVQGNEGVLANDITTPTAVGAGNGVWGASNNNR